MRSALSLGSVLLGDSSWVRTSHARGLKTPQPVQEINFLIEHMEIKKREHFFSHSNMVNSQFWISTRTSFTVLWFEASQEAHYSTGPLTGPDSQHPLW